MTEPQVIRVLKRDGLGRIELCSILQGTCVRRVACGGRWPGSRFVARLLLARERRALRALDGVPGVARLIENEPERSSDGGSLLRGFLPGRALCEADALPRDFFERLEELVRALHERGVCHNDLHKEGNVLVGEDGRPALVDFQLASVHRRRNRTFDVRAREDLRHVWKHRSLYYRALGVADPLAGAQPERSLVAELWRRFAKPVYNRLRRRARGVEPGARPLDARGETDPRRFKGDPWPRWSAPVGPHTSARPPTSTGSSPAAPPLVR